MSSSYARVSATLIRRTANAALVEVEGSEVWIPRALLHGGDDIQLDRLMRGETFSFRVMEWKAKELGL